MSSADVKQLQHKAKLAALDAERRVLRLCARVRSEDEFDAALTEADSKQQLVVVDFAADWFVFLHLTLEIHCLSFQLITFLRGFMAFHAICFSFCSGASRAR